MARVTVDLRRATCVLAAAVSAISTQRKSTTTGSYVMSSLVNARSCSSPLMLYYVICVVAERRFVTVTITSNDYVGAHTRPRMTGDGGFAILPGSCKMRHHMPRPPTTSIDLPAVQELHPKAGDIVFYHGSHVRRDCFLPPQLLNLTSCS